MGEGGGKGEAVAHDQSRHVEAHGNSQERRRRGRLHPAGQLLHLCNVFFHAWPITYLDMKRFFILSSKYHTDDPWFNSED